MHFIDLNTQQARIKSKIDTSIQNVLTHGKYIMGPEVSELEQRLSEYVNCRHAIACSSGTDALLMALMAYDVGPGDAIFAPPFTFIATAETISLIGATPVFVDIEPDTYNIDPDKLQQAIQEISDDGQLTPKGIIAVDLFGLPADYNRINPIAEQNHLFVIEDAAQSFGATYHGRRAGGLANIGCTSFFPAKPLGCYGDGGMCFTNDDTLADKLRSIRVHGKGNHKYDNARIGINGRLDTIQAAILEAKFDIFPEEVELRNRAAQRYSNMLNEVPSLQIPVVPQGFKSVWAQYSILAESEDHRITIQNALKGEGIPSAIYYPKPLHLQTAFKPLGYKPGDFPISEDCSNRIFSIPMHPYLSEPDQEKIVKKGYQRYRR